MMCPAFDLRVLVALEIFLDDLRLVRDAFPNIFDLPSCGNGYVLGAKLSDIISDGSDCATEKE